MMRVYVAGPYTKGDVAVNVANAIDAGTVLAEEGFYPFIPHLFHFWHFRSRQSYEFWTNQDMEWLKVCHALIRLPGESAGADAEVAEAVRLGIEVYDSVLEFLAAES